MAAAALKAGADSPGAMAKLDIKDAVVETARGKPRVSQPSPSTSPGTLAGSIRWSTYALTQQMYDYLVHDALIKPMPQERPPTAWPSTPR